MADGDGIDSADRLVDYLRSAGQLDAPGHAALYQRLRDAFKTAIQDAVIGPGAVLPGERDLAARLGLSRVTVRKALRDLVDQNLLVQRQGARTAVASRVEKPASVFTSFSQDMLARGLKPAASG